MKSVKTRATADLFFPQGLVGYPAWQRFRLVHSPDLDPVAIMESEEDPEVVFFVTRPTLVLPSYAVTITPATREALHLADDEEPAILCILVISEEPFAITANLLGPILFNPLEGIAYQAVLQDSTYSARHPVPIPALTDEAT